MATQQMTPLKKTINSISDVYSTLNSHGIVNKSNVLDIAKMLDGDSHAVK